MQASLARDQHGDSFDLPPEAAYWRVRRHTGGRPSTVLGSDGEPLFIPIHSDRPDLRAYGCAGSIRLEAVDEERHPVSAPVAFVELGSEERQSSGASADGNADLVRVSFESMTRTMEAMQRAQVERERTLAQKEKALVEAQVSAQRTNVELMIALIERLGGGKPQDPLAILKQQLAFQKALEQGAQRNAGVLPVVGTVEEEQSAEPPWMKPLQPLLPAAAAGVQEMIVNAFAKDDPQKASEIRRSMSTYANAFCAAQNTLVNGGATAYMPLLPVEVRNAVASRARLLPKALREAFALLDDERAERFGEILDGLDDAAFEQLGQEAARVALDERAVWARLVVEKLGSEPKPVEPVTPPGLSEVPPALIPVLAQLTSDEIVEVRQMLAVLDRATVESVCGKLVAMAPEKALAPVRRAIDEAKRRSASVAHRAVASAFSDGERSAS